MKLDSKIILQALIVVSAAGCDLNTPKKPDSVVRGETPVAEKPVSWASWVDSRFYDVSKAQMTLSADQLGTGAPAGTIKSTYAVSRLPIGFFSSGIQSVAGVHWAPLPYLAFQMDSGSQASVRYIKSVSGKNLQSQSVVPRACPAELAGPVERDNPDVPNAKIATVTMCIPLINQIVPDYLKSTDVLGIYAHTFMVSVKNPGAEAGVTLTTKLTINILIPDSKLSLDASPELKALKMRDRLLIVSNDLAGSPRRDFPAAIISSDIPPGVDTKWVLKFTDLKMTIEEDVFFEMPISPGLGRLKPNVSRGQSFLRRSTSIDSNINFRLRVQDFYDASKIFDIRSSGVTTIGFPILDPSAPLRLIVLPDFKSDTAVMSMSKYVKPYYPIFCKDQAQNFKPEEWRQASINIPGYTACDSATKSRIASIADKEARHIVSSVETFFGSFSYKAMDGRSLGGLSGILSARVMITGTLEAAVANPLNAIESVSVGKTTFSFAYTLPSALTDMQEVVRGVGVPPGLDVIFNAIPSKGVIDPPLKNGLPPFPFIGEWSSNVLF